MPARAHDGDAGVDLFSAIDLELAPGQRELVPTGIAVAIPHGMVGLVHPRSGLAIRVGLSIVNAPGTVDAGYRGEIKVALINNGNLGMVRQWQTLFYEQRYSQTDLATHSRRIPDFVKLAEALGCVGLRCEREEDVAKVIEEARAINDRPVVIDFIVGADAQVWPMVAAGTSNDEIQAARGIRPLFDDDETAEQEGSR